MKVGTVVILYHPDRTHLDRMITQINAVNWAVVLVDNSPVPQDFSASPSVHYIHCSENIGIAAAQNLGLHKLVGLGLEYGLLLDQDSQLSAEMLSGLARNFLQAEKLFDKVAVIGPRIVCEYNGKPVHARVQRRIDTRGNLISVSQIIASGMLFKLKTFLQIGEKEEALFIDGVDHEWCWRARKAGYHVIQCQDVPMLHRQGDARHRYLGITFKRGAPIRLYYQVRNVLILSRRSYVPLYWKLRHLSALPLRWMVNRCFFPDGKQRGDFFRRGLIDGLTDKRGKLKV
ncbi:glycosyltransferase family 2 protein [Alteromonas aestuariivivens]|uniref:Glycosyltransferase family 2 protein n=1 Tax=Alteromonas aestuariivivens TaxID=1938339 RepID=A0A3D8M498_9ALTE|nr:glycosyltransferase family 2 protein [Alteromonas aestuariivivens]RDV24375.1 glycosyltransferase family 2 protein [Alteromonas aestuariivivens]